MAGFERLCFGGNMNKIGLLLLLSLATAAPAQQTGSGASAAAAAPADSVSANQSIPEGTLPNANSFPVEQVQMPTRADLYCSGFVSKQMEPTRSYVLGGLESPSDTKFTSGDAIYLTGGPYQIGQRYRIVRELHDMNRYEMFPGQTVLVKAAGQPYSDVALIQIIDTRNKTAIARVTFSCDTVSPGDLAIPFAEKEAVVFHSPFRFDRFAPPNGKLSGRILLAKDFDSELGSGGKVYLNVGANQGVKVGDYFRAVRSYETDLKDPVDSLYFKAALSEDTQAKPPSIDPKFGTKTSGPTIHVADFPRRAVGEIVIIATTPTTATGMVVFAMEDILIGDGVEMDEQR